MAEQSQFAGRSWIATIAVIFSLLNPGLLWAGTFQVNPVRVELTAQQKSAALTVQNNGDEPVVVQLQTVDWTQVDGKDVYQPSADLLATPPIFTIQPGTTQIVRVGLRREPDAGQELSYRLFLQEVPAPPKPGFRGLQMALRVVLPVFLQPKNKAAPELKWKVQQESKDRIKVSLKNEGKAHVQITDFSVFVPGNEQALAVQQVARYLLPCQAGEWQLKTNPAQAPSAATVHVTAYTDAGKVDTDVALDKP